jgi:hypothetical protein
MPANDDFWAFAAWSALLAVTSLISPILPAGTVLALVASSAWLIVVGMALYRFRRRALWFLLGAPLALAWPCVFLVFMVSCSRGDCL